MSSILLFLVGIEIPREAKKDNVKTVFLILQLTKRQILSPEKKQDRNHHSTRYYKYSRSMFESFWKNNRGLLSDTFAEWFVQNHYRFWLMILPTPSCITAVISLGLVTGVIDSISSFWRMSNEMNQEWSSVIKLYQRNYRNTSVPQYNKCYLHVKIHRLCYKLGCRWSCD